MLKKKLNDIFRHYKKKYKLETKLFFENYERVISYYSNSDKIICDLEEAKIANCPHIKKLNQQKKLIYMLLHEIKHAIDWKYNRKEVKKEYKQTNMFLYEFDYNYAMSLPSEKRANKFAKKELIKC